MVQFPGLSQHHLHVGVGGVVGVIFVGQWGREYIEVLVLAGGCLGRWTGKPQVGETPSISVIDDFLFCLTIHSSGSAAVDADLVQVMLEFEQAIPLDQLEMPG